MAQENNIQEVDMQKMVGLILLAIFASNGRKYLPHGRYIYLDTENNSWFAIDNTTGDAWTKALMDKEKALEWLNNKEKLKNELQADLGGRE